MHDIQQKNLLKSYFSGQFFSSQSIEMMCILGTSYLPVSMLFPVLKKRHMKPLRWHPAGQCIRKSRSDVVICSSMLVKYLPSNPLSRELFSSTSKQLPGKTKKHQHSHSQTYSIIPKWISHPWTWSLLFLSLSFIFTPLSALQFSRNHSVVQHHRMTQSPWQTCACVLFLLFPRVAMAAAFPNLWIKRSLGTMHTHQGL